MTYSPEYTNALCKINHLSFGEKLRVPLKIAKALMINNHSVIIGGKEYYLCIKNLGLGIYSVELNQGATETKLSK